MAVQVNPNCAPAYFGVARLFLIRKQYDNVLGCCDQALKINPECEDALGLKGAIFFEVKDYKMQLQSMISYWRATQIPVRH